LLDLLGHITFLNRHLLQQIFLFNLQLIAVR